MIAVERVSKCFEQEDVLENVDFTVLTGEFFGIIGPNGSGKSTLLRLISGVESPSEGTVRLRGREVRSYPRKQLARWLAVLQQDSLPPVGFTVREVVEMGRYPFQNWLGEEPEDPSARIDSILSRLGLESLSGRGLDQLSGGERQRVALGQVMAQQPELLLLDEPTTYLDIGYQVQMMDYVRGWQRDTGLTVVAVLHDLNLAAQYCDRILVLHRGRMIRLGPPEEVICADLIESVYGTRPLVLPHPAIAVPQILLMPGSNGN